ncbi:MAG: hypothetical protein PVI79_07240 [Gammaproteobacteria bacterium]|jgi:hypothetical protein
METLITLANLLYLLSYFVRDMLRLRLLTIVAASILVAYFWMRPEPIMTVVYWNGFFILLNLWQVSRLVFERRAGFDPSCRVIEALRARFCTRSRPRVGMFTRCAPN